MEHKPERKIQSANLLRKKDKKPSMEDMPELVQFKKMKENGNLSKDETIDYLKKMIDVVKDREWILNKSDDEL